MKLGIISDAHGHVGAFNLGLDALRNAGAESFFFLGDSVGYIPGTGVVDCLHELAIPSVMGNHEAMLLDCGYPKEREDIYQLEATRKLMSAEALEFIRCLAPSERRTLEGRRCLFVHGSPTDPTFDYVYPDTDLSPFDCIDDDVVFMGNTHRPFIRRRGNTLFVNVGSCGLPRDNDPRGAACLFDTQTAHADILRFDIAGPSLDVLDRFELHAEVIRLLRAAAGK